MNTQEKLNLLRQILTLVGGLLAGAGVVTDATASTAINDIMVIIPAAVSLGSLVWSVYAHWNMVKVPEQTKVVTGTGSIAASAALKSGMVAVALALAASLMIPQAHAQPRLTGNPIKDIKTAVGQTAAAAATSTANALAQPFQDLANFIGEDNTQAVGLSTAIPSLQDGNGQQCWIAMQSFAAIFKAHPIPVTLKIASDIEALRLAEMAANKICGNSACTQVFADLTNTVQAASPVTVPIPSLNSLCSKVPQIAVVAPVTVTPPAAPAASK